MSPVPAHEGRDRGQHEDGDQVLGDQDAEDRLACALLEAKVLEGVGHDHGGRRSRPARPPGGWCGYRAPNTAATWKPSAKVRPTSMTATTPAVGMMRASVAQVELEAEREHQQDDAELGEGADGLFVGEERDGGVRAHDDAGQQVAQHHRQAELLARDGGERRRAQHQGQVLQEGVRAHQHRLPMHVSSPAMSVIDVADRTGGRRPPPGRPRLDAARAGVLRGDERKRPTGRRRSSVAGGRRGALPGGRAARGAAGAGARRLAPDHRPARLVGTGHLRHALGALHILRTHLAPHPPRGRGDARAPRRRSSWRCWPHGSWASRGRARWARRW